MDISHHIKTLLSAHDCVIIPNFGAFIADYSPAVVSDEKSTIPSKDILFNRNLTRNDGLLINALIEEGEHEYSQAKIALENYVADINSRLADGEKIRFEGIGELSFDEAGFVHFEGDENNTCLLDSYGLQAVTLEKIDKEDAPVVPQVKVESSNRTRRIIVRASSVAAVVALLLIFATPLSDRSVVDHASLGFDNSTPKVVTNSTPVSALKDAAKVTTDETGLLPLESADVASLPLPRKTPAVKVISSQKNYHIIIASLPNESLAHQYVTTFQRKYDFDSVETVPGSGRYRISVAHFDKKEEAVAFVQSLRLLNPTFDDAWVLPQTLN